MTNPAALYEAISEETDKVLVGNDDIVEGLTISLLTRGHVLLEGVPGVAKTTIANIFALATGLEYNRVQMTPDILPADITGTKVYREATGEFQLQRGPVFANVVVADEVNRATPKTQSALLEAMQERQVTIEGDTLELPFPFIVIATQNPLEHEGVYELPEAQRDRFQFKLTVDIPARDQEREILDVFDAAPDHGPQLIDQVVSPHDILEARDHVGAVYIDDAVKEYILDIVEATRQSPDTEHGGSPRASLAFLNGAKAYAAIHDRAYVIPDDVKQLAEQVLIHRLILSTDAELSDLTTSDVVADVISTVAPPGSSEVTPTEEPTVGDGSGLTQADEDSDTAPDNEE